MKRVLSGMGLMVLLFGSVALASRVPFSLSENVASKLTIAFRHTASNRVVCRPATPEELEKMLPHMRQEKICERERFETRLRIFINDQLQSEQEIKPLGLNRDGLSVALISFPIRLGDHRIQVILSEEDEEKSEEREKKEYVFDQTLNFSKGQHRLVEFKKDKGFVVY